MRDVGRARSLAEPDDALDRLLVLLAEHDGDDGLGYEPGIFRRHLEKQIAFPFEQLNLFRLRVRVQILEHFGNPAAVIVGRVGAPHPRGNDQILPPLPPCEDFGRRDIDARALRRRRGVVEIGVFDGIGGQDRRPHLVGYGDAVGRGEGANSIAANAPNRCPGEKRGRVHPVYFGAKIIERLEMLMDRLDDGIHGFRVDVCGNALIMQSLLHRKEGLIGVVGDCREPLLLAGEHQPARIGVEQFERLRLPG